MALDELRERAEILAKLLVLETRADNMQEEIRELVVQLEGPPRGDSLRGRVHKLENDHAAANAAAAAVEAAKLMEGRSVSWKLRLIVAAGGLIVVVCTIVSTIIALRGGK